MRLMRLRPLSEIRRTADSETKRVGAKPARNKKYRRKTGAHGVVGDGMSGNARSVIKDTCLGAGRSRAGVRAPIVAMKRVTTVEPRGVGKWKREGHIPATEPAGSARG